VVTHQLQVERRTAKAHRPKTNALPLDHATNGAWDIAFGNIVSHPSAKRVTEHMFVYGAVAGSQTDENIHAGVWLPRIHRTVDAQTICRLLLTAGKMKVRIDFGGRFSIKFNDTLARMLGFAHTIIYRFRQNSSTRVASKEFNLSP